MKPWTTEIRLCRVAGMAGLACLAGLSGAARARADDAPVLSAPILGARLTAAQLSLTNCSDTNFDYVVQISADLTNWTSVTTNFATGPGSPVTVPATNKSGYYRLMEIPHVPAPLFQWGILAISNIDLIGNYVTVDSYDSSNPLYSTAGQYDPAKSKAGGNVATPSPIIGAVVVGNGNIYGRVMTGPGTVQNAVQVGPNGFVGDLAWQSGIEPGYWTGNFFVNFPDVTPPPIGNPALPAPDSNGVVDLSGGNYTISPGDTNLSKPLNINGATTLWVQGSFFPGAITIATTNNAGLTIYVGRTSGTGDSLFLSGSNQPGFPANLQIYGLPSLTAITFSGTAVFVGTIYAPEATVNSGGSSTICGAIIVNRCSLISHSAIHYDENLLVNGPVF